MKLYDGGKAPNPRRVRVFLAEKNIEIETVPVDMGAMGHRDPVITALNPLQRLPVLELDDGTVLTESIAICRYFEALHPEPALFGPTALELLLFVDDELFLSDSDYGMRAIGAGIFLLIAIGTPWSWKKFRGGQEVA